MKNERLTQFSIVVGFLALYFLFGSPYFLYTSLAVGLLTLLSRQAGRWIALGWQKLGMALGWVNARVLLSLVFCLLLTPLALLSRLFGSNFFKKFSSEETSHFVIREHEFTKEDLEELW